MPDNDLARIAREFQLEYPIATKSEFVEQMSRSPEVTFRGVAYETRFAAALIPGFFFPISSADDLIRKATELLATRGLRVPAPPSTGATRRPGGRPDGPARSIEEILADLETTITDPTVDETDRHRIEALDVLTHAFEFVGHPQALELWRAAVAGHLPATTRDTVGTMLRYMKQAIDRGDWDAVSAVCDCLFDLYHPESPRVHIGGIRRTAPPA
ncbi:hypothetical protein [Plantactinospora endophytica]|uniref:Uncharacterized protein n=1 Tax=Plantactinospora endophytica TaxID=673535 RepID=A0ABQ4EBL7_9ACTN|nr:hypothetical protein [Plantactinospora endophytica]GIG92098.1 hypothetical protein Pen02_70340 [Plantactinospora endophytica]